VDTPPTVVSKVWEHIHKRRSQAGKVVDFGAGDGRFAASGKYLRYVGYEIDRRRCGLSALPKRATLIQRCAFSEEVSDADVCLGNPPYVRNQDLPAGWRESATASLKKRTGVALSGLANAWQYFFLLSLASTKPDGLVAIVIPYEWVSRPSVRALRCFILEHRWNVSVYRLRDDTFDNVLTTSSITIIDKNSVDGRWKFFEENPDGGVRRLPSESGGPSGVVGYSKRSEMATGTAHAKRGLSPGTQEVLTLTEGERVRSGLRVGSDVVPCITTLRHLAFECTAITEKVFRSQFRDSGIKCWLVRTDREPKARLRAYLASVPASKYETATCLQRERWWEFAMPGVPSLLIASGFRSSFPKVVVNAVSARAIGAVCGIYGVPRKKQAEVVKALRALDLSDRIVPHSNGLRKVEIHQLNTLLGELSTSASGNI
jgi:hypothetical protein